MSECWVWVLANPRSRAWQTLAPDVRPRRTGEELLGELCDGVRSALARRCSGLPRARPLSARSGACGAVAVCSRLAPLKRMHCPECRSQYGAPVHRAHRCVAGDCAGAGWH
jgi:hypothetical protein